MEHLKNNLQKAISENYPTQLEATQDTHSVSIYKGKLTEVQLVNQIGKIKRVFPKFSKSALLVLQDRFADNKFTDQRMMDSVNHVIDSYTSWAREPNIGDFISFDRKIRIWNYKEVLEKYESPESMRRAFTEHIFIEENRYALSEDLIKFNIMVSQLKK